MAVDTVYRFNGTNGAAVTSGFIAGTQLLNGGSMTFASAAADEGATGLQVTSAAGLIAQAKWDVDGESLVGADGVGQWSTVSAAFWTPTVAPNADSTLMQLRNTTGGVVMRLLYSTAGNIYMLGRTGASQLLLATAPLNTKYYLVGGLRVDTATTGKFQFQLRLGATYATATGNTITSSAADLGAVAFNEIALGVTTVLTASTTHKYDTVRISSAVTTSGTFPGYPAAYSAPSATAPTVAPIASKQVTAGTGETFTASASDPSGTIDHYTWRVVSSPSTAPGLTNGSTATVTVAATSTPGTVVLGVIATSTTGLDSPEVFTNLWINAATGVDVAPNRVVSNAGGWTHGGTATDLVDGMSDSGEWIQSPAGPSGAAIVIGGPPVAATAAYVKVDLTLYLADGTTLASVGQTGSVQLQYFSGTTAVSNLVDVTVTRTVTTTTLTLTTAQNAALDAAGRWDPRLYMSATAA